MSVPFADLERYRSHAASLGLPNPNLEQISSVFRIMQSFVDAAFGEHPVQTCLSARQENPSRTHGEHDRVANAEITQDQGSIAVRNGERDWTP